MSTLKTCPPLGAAAAAILFATSAAAQNWTGPYLGGSAGYASGRDDGGETILFDRNLDGAFKDTVATAAGADAFSPGFCGGSANGPTPGAGCTDRTPAPSRMSCFSLIGSGAQSSAGRSWPCYGGTSGSRSDADAGARTA